MDLFKIHAIAGQDDIIPYKGDRCNSQIHRANPHALFSQLGKSVSRFLVVRCDRPTSKIVDDVFEPTVSVDDLISRSLLSQIRLPTVQLLMKANDGYGKLGAGSPSHTSLQRGMEIAVAQLKDAEMISVEKIHGATGSRLAVSGLGVALLPAQLQYFSKGLIAFE